MVGSRERWLRRTGLERGKKIKEYSFFFIIRILECGKIFICFIGIYLFYCRDE